MNALWPFIWTPGAPAGGGVKVWNGSAWAVKPVKYWTGSAWVEKPVKYWNGSAWVTAGGAPSGIARVGIGATSQTVASSFDVAIPTASNGNTLVLIVSHESVNNSVTTPSGWTLIASGVGWTNGVAELRIYRRVRDGTEGATVTVSTSASGQLMGVCVAYSGVSTEGFTATVSQFDGTTRATPTGTATAESAIIHIWAMSSGGTPTYTLPNPSDLVAGFYNSAANWFLGVEDQLSVSAGTTTGRTITATSGAVYNAMQIELLKA